MNDNPYEISGDQAVSFTVPRLLLVFLLHVAVWIGGIFLFAGTRRVSFAYLGDASTPWVRQFILPLSLVLVLQILYVSSQDTWGPVMRDDERSSKQWLWCPVAVLVIGAPGLAVVTQGWTPAGSGYLLGVAATVVMVGICEELAFRGYLLVGARHALGSERSAVLFTSVLFGLFHLPNALLGSPMPGELAHVVQTALLGLIFYALRRLSGTLLLPIVVHAAWDLVVLQANWDALSAIPR